MPVYMTTTETVKEDVQRLQQANMKVKVDYDAGIVIAVDPADGVKVYSAIQKSLVGPWIVICTDSVQVKWKSA